MKKNIYFNIKKIFINLKNIELLIVNKFEDDIILLIEDNHYLIKSYDEILVPVKKKELTITLMYKNINDDYNISIKDHEIKGFHESSIIETPNGPKNINEISSGDLIIGKNGQDLLICNVYVFEIDTSSGNQPILIEKSKCGINLPYSNLIMSIKSSLTIKKVILKGRNLFLNGKAKLYEFEDKLKYYSIETQNKSDYLLNGFIVESI